MQVCVLDGSGTCSRHYSCMHAQRETLTCFHVCIWRVHCNRETESHFRCCYEEGVQEKEGNMKSTDCKSEIA